MHGRIAVFVAGAALLLTQGAALRVPRAAGRLARGALPRRESGAAPAAGGDTAAFRTRLFASSPAIPPPAEPLKLGWLGKIFTEATMLRAGKVGINAFGFYYMAQSLFFGLFWLLLLKTLQLLTFLRVLPEAAAAPAAVYVNKIWGWCTLVTGASHPVITGLENLPPKSEAVIYAPNHASWMDIPYIAMMPRRFRFVAKSDLLKVPILGLAMKMCGALFVDRSKASQLALFRGTMQMISDGHSIVIFPEGTRSKTGKLSRFRGGMGKIATRTGARVVPISIRNSHRVMPPSVIMPRRPGLRLASLHIHAPIESEGKTDEELDQAVFEAIAAGLPADQQPDRFPKGAP